MKSTTATVDAPREEAEPSVREKAVDAVRQALHVSHEARLLKSMAADAVDEGVYAAKRVVKTARRWTHEAADVRDEAAHRIRRDPFTFVGMAFALGIPVGFLFGWMSRKPAKRIDQNQ